MGEPRSQDYQGKLENAEKKPNIGREEERLSLKEVVVKDRKPIENDKLEV